MYINACSTISHQNSFQNENWINELTLLDENNELITPNYKEFIAPTALRRMSKIIRMGLTCAKDCVKQSGIENPDAIIVGTALGCLADTEKFLNNALTLKGLIPPTAFIQSTHNTIAGQISLELKNHNYNVTHTQNSLSFEHALIDAILCLNEDDSNILVGAVDEEIPLLGELTGQFGLDSIKNKLTSSASFFMLSNNKTETSKAKLVDSYTVGLNTSDSKKIINEFLERNNTSLADVDLVLSNSYGTVSDSEIKNLFDSIEVIPVEQHTGYHLTTAAFGMHLATEMINQKSGNQILIYNTLNNSNIGLTLLQSLEA
ncbi:MAG: beta-ketoacyl synthase chain length factor [Flavobacteriales bacterium]|nr:beta-ketoacyl synthase chain length factor [Flavobacteriales bacterium]